MTPGAALRTLRITRKESQGDLAEALGITQSHLCRVEGGRAPSGLPLFRKAANHYQVPVAFFFLTENSHGSSYKKELSQIQAKVLAP